METHMTDQKITKKKKNQMNIANSFNLRWIEKIKQSKE